MALQVDIVQAGPTVEHLIVQDEALEVHDAHELAGLDGNAVDRDPGPRRRVSSLYMAALPSLRVLPMRPRWARCRSTRTAISREGWAALASVEGLHHLPARGRRPEYRGPRSGSASGRWAMRCSSLCRNASGPWRVSRSAAGTGMQGSFSSSRPGLALEGQQGDGQLASLGEGGFVHGSIIAEVRLDLRWSAVPGSAAGACATGHPRSRTGSHPCSGPGGRG